MTERFYVYKHWTLELVPRCFYVGRGLENRSLSKRNRNHKWYAIVKRYGLRVEVCIGPINFEASNECEIEWIARENTFSTNHSHDDPSDIGCNFTLGGGGVVGLRQRWSDETNKRRSCSLKAYKKTPEHQAKINASLTGIHRKPDTIETRQRKSLAAKAHKKSTEHQAKINATLSDGRMSIAQKGKKHPHKGTPHSEMSRAKMKQTWANLEIAERRRQAMKDGWARRRAQIVEKA